MFSIGEEILLKPFLEYFLPGAAAMAFLGTFAFICISLIQRSSYAFVLVVPITLTGILIIFLIGLVKTIGDSQGKALTTEIKEEK